MFVFIDLNLIVTLPIVRTYVGILPSKVSLLDFYPFKDTCFMDERHDFHTPDVTIFGVSQSGLVGLSEVVLGTRDYPAIERTVKSSACDTLTFWLHQLFDSSIHEMKKTVLICSSVGSIYRFHKCLLIFPASAGVAGVRVATPNVWANNPYVVSSNYPQLSLMQTSLPNEKQGQMDQLSLQRLAQLQSATGGQQLTPMYGTTGSAFVASTGYLPQAAYILGSQPTGQGTYMVASDSNPSLLSLTTSNGATSGNEVISSSNTKATSATSGTAVVGSPTDGVIGADGQILGSTQDTAVVESAGQLGPTVVRADIPVTYQQDSLIPYQSQQLLYAQGRRLLGVDEYGRPVYIV
ncbi:hypothetical protein CLF_104567 [Clonorchis sinensis]|uniref:Uncharacterized protein n=1 Tax=Clonorchis sinensis TaxID=79923 RepID=G7YBX5_CLOSI|nr:hypothetical protein CLF_104567 [Clonorchis sinensis]